MAKGLSQNEMEDSLSILRKKFAKRDLLSFRRANQYTNGRITFSDPAVREAPNFGSCGLSLFKSPQSAQSEQTGAEQQ